MNKGIIFSLLVYELQVLLCQECPGDPNRYIKRGDKYCQKIYNCQPGHEISTCVDNCTKELCKPCLSGSVQPFQIQSTTTTELNRKCFRPKGSCGEDQVPVRNGRSTVGCQIADACQCDMYRCWYGSNSCTCSRFYEQCPKDEYLVFDGNTPQCRKCPDGSRKNKTGCGPCQIIDPYGPSTPSTVEPITTAPITTSDVSTRSSDISTFKTTTPPGPLMEDRVLWSIAGASAGLVLIAVVMVTCICIKRRGKPIPRRANSDEEHTEEYLDEVAENTTPVARPLLMPESTEELLSRQTPKSPVVSETEQPGIFHPNDPKALHQRHLREQGFSLDDDSYLSTYNDSTENTTGILDLPSNTEAPLLDTTRETEGVHTDYLINKLEDENCEVKQPIQCEEDSLRSETFQKYTYSDITQRKELFQDVLQSLTDEKVLCVSQVSDTTDPKHYVDSLQ